MKRKKTKPFIRHISIETNGNIDMSVIEVLNELGLTIYEDPSGDGDLLFISNRVLTYGWLRKNAKKYQIDPKWLSDALWIESKDQPLEEYTP